MSLPSLTRAVYDLAPLLISVATDVLQAAGIARHRVEAEVYSRHSRSTEGCALFGFAECVCGQDEHYSLISYLTCRSDSPYIAQA